MRCARRYFGYPNTELCALTPGSVGLVTQSGGTLQYLGQAGAQRGVKFSYMISSGNEINLDLADYVNFLVDDPHTKVITLFIEGIRRPQIFMAAAAKALAAGKPIIAIKTGKSQKSRDSARSHTGAVAGDYGAFTAMCERYGIVVCPTLDDMVEMTLAFQSGRLPKGPRVGWVTTSGGTVDLLYDYLDEMGGTTAPDFDAATKAAIRPLVSAELRAQKSARRRQSGRRGGIGGAVPRRRGRSQCRHAGLGQHAAERQALARSHPAARRAGEHRQAGDRLRAHELSGRPAGGGVPGAGRLPVSAGPAGDRAGAGGAGVLRGAPRPPRSRRCRRRTERAETLEGAALQAALASRGLPPPKSGRAASPAEAAEIAARIGFPVALKIASAEISHKTEVGGVRLHLGSAPGGGARGHARSPQRWAGSPARGSMD